MKKKLDGNGKIVTFYSYKGGVGRSMALANIATILCEWGYKILIIDWDLEAPGLENFYKPYLPLEKVKSKNGLIDILDFSKDEKSSVSWRDCITPINFNSNTLSGNSIDLISSGNRDDNYYNKVRSFDFNKFYENHDGGNIIEKLRNEWKQEYDYVLIDSRTGVTDIGGVCTIQLPDILLLLFTPTTQSYEGIKSVAAKAYKAQKQLPYDRLNLLILPIVTRLDNNEYELTDKWINKFEAGLAEIYKPWLPEHVDRKEFILNTKVPYISYFSYDETLPAMVEGAKNPSGMGYAYQSIAALIATQLNYTDLLTDNRGGLISLARNDDYGGAAGTARVYESTFSVWIRTLNRRSLTLLTDFFKYRVPLYILVTLIPAMVVLLSYFEQKNSEKYEQEHEKSALKHRQIVDSISYQNSLARENYSRIIDSLNNACLDAAQENALLKENCKVTGNAKKMLDLLIKYKEQKAQQSSYKY